MREIEAKYRVPDVEALLAALKRAGVELGEPTHQDDQAYAPCGWTPEAGKAGFTFARLRTQDGRHVFTTKTPLSGAMDCAEAETVVADRAQMHTAVLAMGYTPTVRITKTRRSGTTGGWSVCVDDVDGLGAFIELEAVIDDDRDGTAVQQELDAWARGLDAGLQRTTDTYDTLVRAGARG
jgi:adenylate cyclase class 2